MTMKMSQLVRRHHRDPVSSSAAATCPLRLSGGGDPDRLIATMWEVVIFRGSLTLRRIGSKRGARVPLHQTRTIEHYRTEIILAADCQCAPGAAAIQAPRDLAIPFSSGCVASVSLCGIADFHAAEAQAVS